MAARAAGRFKHNGQFVMLVPNELDPEDQALGMPLPLPRPKIEENPLLAIFSRPQTQPEEKPELAATPASAATTAAAVETLMVPARSNTIARLEVVP